MKTIKIGILTVAGVLLGFYAAHCQQNFTVFGPQGMTVGHQSPNGNTWAIGPDSVVTATRSYGNTVIFNSGPGTQTLQDLNTFWNSQQHNPNPWAINSIEDDEER